MKCVCNIAGKGRKKFRLANKIEESGVEKFNYTDNYNPYRLA